MSRFEVDDPAAGPVHAARQGRRRDRRDPARRSPDPPGTQDAAGTAGGVLFDSGARQARAGACPAGSPAAGGPRTPRPGRARTPRRPRPAASTATPGGRSRAPGSRAARVGMSRSVIERPSSQATSACIWSTMPRIRSRRRRSSGSSSSASSVVVHAVDRGSRRAAADRLHHAALPQPVRVAQRDQLVALGLQPADDHHELGDEGVGVVDRVEARHHASIVRPRPIGPAGAGDPRPSPSR